MNEKRDFTLNDIHLLKIGRHFRISETTKAIVSRNEQENKKLTTFAEKGDWVIETTSLPGPVTLVRGDINERIKLKAASLTASYGKGKNLDSIEIKMSHIPEGKEEIFVVKPFRHEEIAELFIS